MSGLEQISHSSINKYKCYRMHGVQDICQDYPWSTLPSDTAVGTDSYKESLG